MKFHFVLLGFFLVSASLAMASPASQVQPADWVDRMIANHAAAEGIAAPASRTDVVGITDWVDRLAAAGTASQRPGDWIDRMIADRSPQTAVLAAQVGSEKPMLVVADTSRDMAKTE